MAIRVSFVGVGIDEMTTPEAIASISGVWQSASKARVFFVNAHCFNLATHNPAYRDALGAAEWVLPDGSGVLLASRLLRLPIRHNLNGTDFIPELLRAAAQEGRSIYLLGARPGVAATAAERLVESFPGLRIAGTHHGYFAPDDSAHIVASINAAKPDILIVALGAPQQELWLTEQFGSLDAHVSLAVGAFLDFSAHVVPRAPLIFRRLGMEWIYRLYREPRRLWRRYVIGNAQFLIRIALALLGISETLPAPKMARGSYPLPMATPASAAVATPIPEPVMEPVAIIG